MSQPLHTITPIVLNDTFLNLYVRVNDCISVLNAIKIYDVQATGGVIHKRVVDGGGTREVLQLNLALTGGTAFGYGLGLIGLANPNDYPGGVWEGGTFALRLNYNELQTSAAFVGASGATVFVADDDLISIGATGTRGDRNFRPLKVRAQDSLPYNINGEHRFKGNVYFDGSQVVVNSAQLHIDDNLLFIASAGNTDDPNAASGLQNNVSLAGGSGSGFIIKGLSGDKYIAYRFSDGSTAYPAFRVSENIHPEKSFVSSSGQFVFVGVSGSAPMIAIRTSGQDGATLPLGWKLYQSVTGGSVGTLKIKREGITDFDALELFPNSEVKIGTIAGGSGGNGSFRTEAAKFSVPATRESGALHYSWQNRDIVEIKATAAGGAFAESTSAFLPGTVLTYNNFGQYIRARWDADPSTGYKEAEVVGILEKITSDDFILQVPVTGPGYSSSSFSVNENVTIRGNGYTVRGYIYESLPSAGLSGIRIFVDEFPAGITAGSLQTGTGAIFVGGATLYGSADEDAYGICGSIGITVTDVRFGTIVRQGLFDIQTAGGATGYSQVVGLTAGYLFYLGGTANGNDSSCYGGVTFSPSNEFDPVLFYQSGANVAKPLFVYLGSVGGRHIGMFQHYQGLGITFAVTSFDLQPLYYDNETSEVQTQTFEVFGEIAGRNKIINSGIDFWSRLDAAGGTYLGFDTGLIPATGLTCGITFGSTQRSVYPFGATYQNNTLYSGFVADGYFIDTDNAARKRAICVQRQLVGTTLPPMISTPNFEMKITQVNSTDLGRARLYVIVPDHETLQAHDMNFSFYARTNSAGTVGFTAGIAALWNTGSTYARIENKGAFISNGVAVTGGSYHGYSFGVSGSGYTRYQFAFSTEGLTYPGATGSNSTFLAPFIEFAQGTLTNNESVFLTGFQLTKGMSPKPYDKRPFSDDKGECDRFFQNVVLANGGYYPMFTGVSGPSIFTAANLQVPMYETPRVLGALDLVAVGVSGAATGDALNVRRNSISVLRNVSSTSPTYNRYFESVYSLDASGFSGTVANRLVGLA